jgi:hypothetical protein
MGGDRQAVEQCEEDDITVTRIDVDELLKMIERLGVTCEAESTWQPSQRGSIIDLTFVLAS